MVVYQPMDSGRIAGFNIQPTRNRLGASISVDNLWKIAGISGDTETQDVVFSRCTKIVLSGAPKLLGLRR